MGMVEDELLSPVQSDARGGRHHHRENPARSCAGVGGKPGETSDFGTGVRTPCELLISDQLVHRDLYPNVKRELCVFGELMTQLSRDERDRIPVPEKVQHLGNAADGIGTAEVAHYNELLEFVFKKTELKAAGF